MAFVPKAVVTVTADLTINCDTFDCMQSIFSLMSLHSDLDKAMSADDAPFDEDDTIKVHRRSMEATMKAQKVTKYDQKIGQTAEHIAKLGHDAALGFALAEQKRLLESMSERVTFLKANGKGAPHGKSWLDDVASKTLASWASICTHAKHTIATFTEAPKLLPAVEELSQAFP